MGSSGVSESTIRKMTRLAGEFGAVNLSQGFPNEPPPESVRWALAYAVLNGQSPPEGLEPTKENLVNNGRRNDASILTDVANQYSPPMGRPDLRQGVSDYYQRLYGYNIDPDCITITLGATEAVGSALRSIGMPGDKVVILEPFHELYSNQCKIFYLEPTFVTLKQEGNEWKYNQNEFCEALQDAKILLLNTPHNPTGKAFTSQELQQIVDWCLQFDVYIITDEIYEHMIYSDTPHYILPKLFPSIQERVLMCNSIGKSASATGWRLGWCIHPPHLADTYRGIHDQMVVMSPHPMQVATLTYLDLPTDYFRHELRNRYQERIQTLIRTLRKVGFEVPEPEGAYYIFCKYTSVPLLQSMKPMEAAMYMVQTVGVACVPGDNFYEKDMEEGKKYLRFAACRSVSDIELACKLLTDRLL